MSHRPCGHLYNGTSCPVLASADGSLSPGGGLPMRSLLRVARVPALLAVLAPADPKRKLPERLSSVRAEAERLLASLPPAGRGHYQVTYEPAAARMLRTASEDGDPHQLAEIVRRYLYTPSGAQALDLLGT